DRRRTRAGLADARLPYRCADRRARHGPARVGAFPNLRGPSADRRHARRLRRAWAVRALYAATGEYRGLTRAYQSKSDEKKSAMAPKIPRMNSAIVSKIDWKVSDALEPATSTTAPPDATMAEVTALNTVAQRMPKKMVPSKSAAAVRRMKRTIGDRSAGALSGIVMAILSSRKAV